MRRRIVFSLGEFFSSSKPEVARITLSEGMKNASSFATRFQIMALMPTVNIFENGTPTENSYLYCDTQCRRDLLRLIKQASIISIKLEYAEADGWDGKDKRSIACNICFRKSGKILQYVTLFFLIKGGDSVVSSWAGASALFLTLIDE
jgi:hypothetical protein